MSAFHIALNSASAKCASGPRPTPTGQFPGSGATACGPGGCRRSRAPRPVLEPLSSRPAMWKASPWVKTRPGPGRPDDRGAHVTHPPPSGVQQPLGDPAPARTRRTCSAKVPRGQADSVQDQRRLRHTNSSPLLAIGQLSWANMHKVPHTYGENPAGGAGDRAPGTATHRRRCALRDNRRLTHRSCRLPHRRPGQTPTVPPSAGWAVAVDGKSLYSTIRADGRHVHLLNAPCGDSIVPAQSESTPRATRSPRSGPTAGPAGP